MGTGPRLDGMLGITGGGEGSGRSGSSDNKSNGSRAGLRNSQNGLRLNGVNSGFIDSVPGITDSFSGPPD